MYVVLLTGVQGLVEAVVCSVAGTAIGGRASESDGPYATTIVEAFIGRCPLKARRSAGAEWIFDRLQTVRG